jgi:hypothetical protein
MLSVHDSYISVGVNFPQNATAIDRNDAANTLTVTSIAAAIATVEARHSQVLNALLSGKVTASTIKPISNGAKHSSRDKYVKTHAKQDDMSTRPYWEIKLRNKNLYNQ